MKAGEFRIGNLLQDQNGNLLRVNELSEDGSIALYVIDRSKFPLPNGWKSEHIPLTEEILLKCGFVKVKNSNELKYFKSIPNLKCEFHATFFRGQFVIELLNHLMPIVTEVEYLHQLQNLFFALTGKELEINL